jgi:hypothetical protein
VFGCQPTSKTSLHTTLSTPETNVPEYTLGSSCVDRMGKSLMRIQARVRLRGRESSDERPAEDMLSSPERLWGEDMVRLWPALGDLWRVVRSEPTSQRASELRREDM